MLSEELLCDIRVRVDRYFERLTEFCQEVLKQSEIRSAVQRPKLD